MDTDNLLFRDSFRETHQESVKEDHLAEMEELRARMAEMVSNADAQPPQPPLSSRPTYSANEPPATKTLSSVYDSKHVSNYARNNVYLPNMSVGKQKENFSHMIASPFNRELHYLSWESAIRGNDDMMTRLNNTVNEMLVSKVKCGTVNSTRQIVFSFFHEGKTSALDAKEFRFLQPYLDRPQALTQH